MILNHVFTMLLDDVIASYFLSIGRNGNSKPIPLNTTGGKLLQARSRTTYKIILPKSLGDLDYIRVFHDNTGKGILIS